MEYTSTIVPARASAASWINAGTQCGQSGETNATIFPLIRIITHERLRIVPLPSSAERHSRYEADKDSLCCDKLRILGENGCLVRAKHLLRPSCAQRSSCRGADCHRSQDQYQTNCRATTRCRRHLTIASARPFESPVRAGRRC